MSMLMDTVAFTGSNDEVHDLADKLVYDTFSEWNDCELCAFLNRCTHTNDHTYDYIEQSTVVVDPDGSTRILINPCIYVDGYYDTNATNDLSKFVVSIFEKLTLNQLYDMYFCDKSNF